MHADRCRAKRAKRPSGLRRRLPAGVLEPRAISRP
jgi:hypothetical protein